MGALGLGLLARGLTRLDAKRRLGRGDGSSREEGKTAADAEVITRSEIECELETVRL